jgi:C-terminal processing protease CtpA/Prc
VSLRIWEWVSSVQIGSFKIKDVIASYPDYEDGGAKTTETRRNGSVGADLLRHFDLTMDYSHKKIYLKPNSNFRLPFEHDMSGLEIYVEEGKSKRFYVARIEPNSPGTAAGMRVGDEIISINFKSVGTLDLEGIESLLKAGDGRSIFIEIFRTESLYKVITLKKRI